jgi:hypothetical protein
MMFLCYVALKKRETAAPYGERRARATEQAAKLAENTPFIAGGW